MKRLSGWQTQTRNGPTRSLAATASLAIALLATGLASLPRTAAAQTPAADGVFVPGGACPAGCLNNDRIGSVSTQGAVLADGRIFAMNENGLIAEDASLYDPMHGVWLVIPCKDCPFQPTFTYLDPVMGECGAYCGWILVAGGWTLSNDGSSYHVPSALTFLFNPQTNTFSSATPITRPHDRHTATLLPGGKVLVAGGCTVFHIGDDCQGVRSSELYDPLAGAGGGWTQAKDMNHPREEHTAALLGGQRCLAAPRPAWCGKVLLAGGVGQLSDSDPEVRPLGNVSRVTEIYNPTDDTWMDSGNYLGHGRVHHTETQLSDGGVLVVGGSQDPHAGNASGFTLRSVELYDPGLNLWHPVADLPATAPDPAAAADGFGGRSDHTATLLPNGKLLVAGGFFTFNVGLQPNALATADLYESGRWVPAGPMSQARAKGFAALIPSGPASLCGQNCGRVVVAGSDEFPPPSADLYISPPRLSAVSPAAGPTAGGTAVTLTGTGLNGLSSVTFEGAGPVTCAGSLSCSSDPQSPDTAFRVVTPPHPAGPVRLQATTQSTPVTAMTSDLAGAPTFTYGDPHIAAILPSDRGPATGAVIRTITGVGLGGATGVQFGDTVVPPKSVSADGGALTFAVPAGDPGSLPVSVITPAPASASVLNPAGAGVINVPGLGPSIVSNSLPFTSYV